MIILIQLTMAVSVLIIQTVINYVMYIVANRCVNKLTRCRPRGDASAGQFQ